MKTGWFKRFLKRMRFKYRVSVVNENTLAETWSARLSRMSVFLFLFAFAMITFVILTALILFTPVRYYLPGFSDSVDRSDLLQISAKVDSLSKELEMQAAYFEVVKGAISGEIKPDSIPHADSVQFIHRTQEFLEKSKKIEDFEKKYENEMEKTE
jgi:lipoprotein NlpD